MRTRRHLRSGTPGSMRGVRPARPLTRIPGRSRMWTLAAWHQRDARSGATSHADARRVVPSRGWRSEAGHRERQGHPNVVLLLRVVTASLLVPTVGPVCGERTRNRGGRRPGAGRKPEDPSPGKQADRAASVPSCHRAPASRARDAADDATRLPLVRRSSMRRSIAVACRYRRSWSGRSSPTRKATRSTRSLPPSPQPPPGRRAFALRRRRRASSSAWFDRGAGSSLRPFGTGMAGPATGKMRGARCARPGRLRRRNRSH